MPNSGVVAVNQGRVDSELPAEGQHQTIPLETVPRNDVYAGQEIERTSEGDQSEKKRAASANTGCIADVDASNNRS